MCIERRVHSPRLKVLLPAVAIVATELFVLSLAPRAVAQTADPPPQLPGLVVTGATLEPRSLSRPSRPPAAAASRASSSEPATTNSETVSDRNEGVPLEQLGTAVTVITGEQLRAQQVRSVADALRSLPGVAVSQTGTSAGFTQVRIRGAEGNHTLVLIDGVEANATTNGEFDFSDLLTEDIERIEVLRGPQSALYGSNALGGVINIVTRSGRGSPIRVTARAEGGSLGTKDGAIQVSGGTNRAWGSASVHYREQDGFNIAPDGALGEKDGSRITSFAARAGAMLTDTLRLNLSVRNVEKRGDRDDQTGVDGRGSGCAISLPPCFTIASDSFSHFNSSVLLLGADLQWDMLGGNLTHVLKATGNITERDDVQIADFGFGFGPPSPFTNTSEAYKIGYQGTYRFQTPMLLAARHSVTGLVERTRESFESDSDFGGFVSASRTQTSVAGEWRGEFFNQVFLSASVRQDENDTLKDFTTWRSGISIPLREAGLRPHASVGTAVKMPTLFEQFGSTTSFVSNPNLLPEESFGWDIGVEKTFAGGKAMVDVTYFSADLKNKIDSFSDFIPCASSPFGCFRPTNLEGKSERQGIEVAGKFQITPNVILGLAYTYLDANNADGQQEVRRPPHSGRADVTYLFDNGRGTFNIAAVYNGDMRDNVFATNNILAPPAITTLDQYWLVAAAASYKLQPGVEVFGRVENLFNQKYEEIFGYETAGLAAYAGVRLTFDAATLSASGVR